MKSSKFILPIIVISQFCCTSLWFAGNGVMPNLIENFNLNDASIGYLTSAVQFGFISGTFIFALFTIADRFSPSKVFFISAILGAAFNLMCVLDNQTLVSLMSLRFLTGFFLAGIYPVGMKIATDYYDKGLGKSLGYLVGALVLGTALPHLLKDLFTNSSWKHVLIATSLLSIFGGLLLLIFIKDGPFSTKSKGFNVLSCFNVFKNIEFRKASFGYFGHMWELYTFWTFVPVLFLMYQKLHHNIVFNIPLLSFAIIGFGSISCILSGYISEKLGVKKTAFHFLLLSCLCCLLSPLIFYQPNKTLFIIFLIFWGLVVIADSPLFSTLVAKNAPSENKGTALTIVNCIGFAITIISIQLLTTLQVSSTSSFIFIILAIGPIFGLLALKKKSVS
ncbi:MFS transporter [Polaribacter vadi]|uniref:MFS transporter n=1 Tax=Polaribacter vadi TaxID=1774273 RepID=A0A1B8U1W2_9FLAO|nr:MFS transporter [Polaribacter vadi]AOW16427.1 MFS transporter [Polaribacter vadi]OBY65874.1 MFS transporter [Polaribacter vadi]